jgi:hypothetical protein
MLEIVKLELILILEFLGRKKIERESEEDVAPQILIVLFLIYLFDNIIQLISLRNLWYYGGW